MEAMQTANIYTIFFSPMSHTRTLAQTLGAMLARQCKARAIMERDITVHTQAEQPAIVPADLVILACPVYGGRVPALAAQRLAALQGNGAPAVLLASYGNRAYEDALVELQDIAAACGFAPLAAAACVAEHTIVPSIATGRPDKGDFQSLADFAAAVAAKAAAAPAGQIPPLSVPGNRPYRDYKPAPLPQSVNDNCVQCGLCARECPAGAIDAADVSLVNKEKCICCMRCIAVCPVQARVPAPAFLNAVREKITPLCRERKQNSYYGV